MHEEEKMKSLITYSNQHADLLDEHNARLGQHAKTVDSLVEYVSDIGEKFDKANDEILIRGIPENSAEDPVKNVSEIFKKIGFMGEARSVIYDIRKFPLKPRNDDSNPTYKAFVICIHSQKIRDKILYLRSQIEKINYYELFPTPSEPNTATPLVSTLYLNPMLFEETFALIQNTRSKCIPLGYKVWQYAGKV